MDFFHGLDNGRHADFKVQYLDRLQVKSIKAPQELNTVFNLHNNWLKPKALPGGCYASKYPTWADHVEKKKGDRKTKGKNDKNQNKEQRKQTAAGQNKDANQEGKRKQGTKKLECFI
jgi:hypothetical protein